MFKTLPFFLSLIFTLAFLTARGQFAAGDRAFNTGLWVYYDKFESKTNLTFSWTRFEANLNPQFLLFASPHFSIGFGLLLDYQREKRMVDFPTHSWTIKSGELNFTPQLYLQYYRPIQGAWYGSTKLLIEPSTVRLSRFSSINSTGQKNSSKIQADKDNNFRAHLIPIIGYRLSKNWLVEGEFCKIDFSYYSKTSNGYKSSSYNLNLTFNPSIFNFRWIYFIPTTPFRRNPLGSVSTKN